MELKTYVKGFRELNKDDISFEGEVEFIEDENECNALNFYFAVWFNPDEVFGTNVSSVENGDWINLYANYIINDRCVADDLEIILNRNDGRIEELFYRLSDAEKKLLLDAMEMFCIDCAGQTIESIVEAMDD